MELESKALYKQKYTLGKIVHYAATACFVFVQRCRMCPFDPIVQLAKSPKCMWMSEQQRAGRSVNKKHPLAIIL